MPVSVPEVRRDFVSWPPHPFASIATKSRQDKTTYVIPADINRAFFVLVRRMRYQA
jgi:hypothetical protein